MLRLPRELALREETLCLAAHRSSLQYSGTAGISAASAKLFMPKSVEHF